VNAAVFANHGKGWADEFSEIEYFCPKEAEDAGGFVKFTVVEESHFITVFIPPHR
jgi:hypothetical protein